MEKYFFWAIILLITTILSAKKTFIHPMAISLIFTATLQIEIIHKRELRK